MKRGETLLALLLSLVGSVLAFVPPGRRALHSSRAKFPFRRAYTGVRERRERSQESLEKTIPTASQLVPQRFGICEACVLRPLQTVPGRIGKSASRPVPFRDPMEEFRGPERLPSRDSRRYSGTLALQTAAYNSQRNSEVQWCTAVPSVAQRLRPTRSS